MTTQPEDIKEASLDFDAECPACSASIEFNPETGTLKCPYCGYEAEIAPPEQEEDRIAQELDFSAAQNRESFEWGVEKKIIICEACAAESIYDALQVADTCPYCGSHQVMEASVENTLAPNGVCQFEVSSKQAGENFHKWIRSRWFTSRAAKRSAKPDRFQGVYLPYWTFDTKTASTYTARYGKHRTVHDSEGKAKTVTDWYSTSGFYQEFIDDHLVSATTRYERKIMDKIEPFYTNNAKAYQPQYVSGFISERYSIGLEDGWKIAQQEIHNHLVSQVEMQVRLQHGADIVSSVQLSTTHDAIKYKYIMLPIWLSSFHFKEKLYRFMVNGQTGKVGGEAPISPLRVTIAVILVAIAAYFIYVYFIE